MSFISLRLYFAGSFCVGRFEIAMSLIRYIIFFSLALGFLSCASDEEIMRKDAELKVIKTNADFPESYMPIEFSNFRTREHYGIVDTCYEIAHKYKLRSKTGTLLEDRHFFILIGDKMSLITKNRTNYINSVPPSTFVWSNIYGDRLENVYLSGHDTTRFLNSYRDYSLVGGGIWADFHYLDSDCLWFLKSNLSPQDSTDIDIKRVLITASNAVFEERAEKMMTGKKQQSNIQYSDKLAIYTRNGGSVERCGTLRYQEREKVISLTSLDSTEKYTFIVDSAFLETKCFKYKLEGFQIRFY